MNLPVPGPIIIIGVSTLVGKRNWLLRMKIGARGGSSPSLGCFAAKKVVATPLLTRPVGVL